MSPAPPSNFRVETIDDVLVVTAVCHQIVAENRDELYAVAGRLAAASGPKRMVLNLENVPQIQSPAIAILINFQKRVRQAGGTLKICAVTPNVMGVFRLIKMDQVLDLAGSQQEAIDALHGKGGGGAATSGGGSWFSKFRGTK